jgi:hypothetical protein
VLSRDETSDNVVLMEVEYADRVLHVDFVTATLDEARRYIAHGATNGIALLEEAGLSPDEAVAELGTLARLPEGSI